ncbi:MAG: hypothetical protein JXA82_16160 [Sedimentisphaerales bacterium]|nr:hypothetical protein [Sedimentisphaerales bacterium]
MRTIVYVTMGMVLLTSGCGMMEVRMDGEKTFGQDVEFLAEHTDAFVLSSPDGQAQVAIVPDYQGRVMTSTAGGTEGFSYGWINYDLVASGKFEPHINVFGGEDRFWMGPEGGQFAIFFAKGAQFNLEDWQTPAVIDTEPFELLSQTADNAVFQKQAKLTNYSGTQFDVLIRRNIHLLDTSQAKLALNTNVPESVKMVAYQSENSITNIGNQAWTKEGGLLSIWILGMYKPSPKTTVVIPFKAGPEAELGPKVNDAYFGKVPPERLVVKDDVLFFSGDGQMRSKIGISPLRAKSSLGSYDAANKVLTIVQYSLPEGVTDYVNSMWELQDKPFAGDAVNSYNDGPASPGAKPLGPFYELETSSPAAVLKPGETMGHLHRTFHLQGPEGQLDAVSRVVLGVGLGEIKSALPK